MIRKLNAFVGSHGLSLKGTKVLIGVSGGVDSVVLLHLLQRLGANVGVAHCNFMLRGADSAADEAFVEQLAKSSSLPFYATRFNTAEIACQQKTAIQETARALRYAWFAETAKREGYTFIAVAHHGDDQHETFFINLIRGSGMGGLKGMPFRRDNIIRPLLFARRAEIEAYAVKHQLSFRNDLSNAKTDYLRNRIRHLMLPAFANLDPRAVKGLSSSISMLNQQWITYSDLVALAADKLISTVGDSILINKVELDRFGQPETILFELLKNYGFSGKVCAGIALAMNGQPGKQFFSDSHRLTIERGQLMIDPIGNHPLQKAFEIFSDTTEMTAPLNLSISMIDIRDHHAIDPSPEKAYVDADRISFPLVVRKWKKGDRFYPIGMKGSKLVSDFFVDARFSVRQKENTWLLCNSTGEIIWVMGYRPDDRFKITANTMRIMHIRLFVSLSK
ncbi:MAG: tRNA lysidine(34) synthetase TilS [Bacteroidales bacterium]|nr:tRNA lysidine(34) synthetase TilS [Bacteroidales bacterium]